MQNKMLTFDIDAAVLELGVKAICFLVTGIDNMSLAPEFDALLKNEGESIKQNLSEEKIRDSTVLDGFRKLHEKIGKTGKRWVSSPENLKNMLLAHQAMPHVNQLVNLYNLVSLQTELALGAHDADHIEGNVSLRLTTGDEKFWPIGAQKPEKIAPGEYAYCDNSNEVLCRMEVRQVEKTKVQPQTKNVFFIVQGNMNTESSYVKETAEKLASLVLRYAGGNCVWL